MSSVNAIAQNLIKILERGIRSDSWGQRLEAATEYQRFVGEYEKGMINFCKSDAAEKEIDEIMKHIKHRASQLTSHQLNVSRNDVSLDQIKTDLQTFRETVSSFQTTLNKRHSSVVAECGENLLLPSPTKQIGMTYLTIKIDKIGLKDAHSYVDPFITILVKDRYGTDLTGIQHTPPSYHIQGQHIIFDMNVHIPIPVDELKELCPDFAIFFEFKHYKEKADKVSTRCYAFVETDEIKNGTFVIELYKKPADYGRKKLYLFTEKTLYLHVQYALEKA